MIFCSVITSLAFFFMPAQTTLYGADLEPTVDLPAGYFVLQNDTTAPDGYMSVRYDDISGYVRVADVTPVDYTPVNKYAVNVRFECDNDGQPVNLRKAPRKSAEILSVLSPAASGKLYGTTTGDALINGAGNTWYYVNVNGAYGYCYSAHVRADKIPPNVIEKEPEPDQPAVTEPTDEPETETPSMSTTAAIIFTVILCIPVPFIMFYLFKKPKDEE